MKNKYLYILIVIITALSCSGSNRKNQIDSMKPELTIQTAAAFKSAEHLYDNEWKLVFRKLDDSLYILFYADINKMKMYKDELVTSSENGYITNPDFINSRFYVNYTEEKITDPLTGENIIINRLKGIIRAKSDRYSGAGIDDDISADNFILDLKKYVKTGSSGEIAEMISYPVIAVINKRKQRISSPEMLIKEYDNIFNSKVKNSVINQSLADITASSKGLKIGTGEIWIKNVNGNILITSINNQ